MDNPIETRDDVKATLQLLYMMDRPYTLFIYSLKVIPNTGLATAMKERGVDIEEISATYMSIPPRANNLMLYIIALWRPPPWLWNCCSAACGRARGAEALPAPRRRAAHAYLTKRVLCHLRVMDFSDPRQDGLLRLEGRPHRAVAQARRQADAAPAASRARDRQGHPRGPRPVRGAGAGAARRSVGRVAAPPGGARRSPCRELRPGPGEPFGRYGAGGEARSVESLPRDHVA